VEKELRMTCKCMGVALGHIFKKDQGIVVELVQDKDFPDDKFGKFIIYREKGLIKIIEDRDCEFESGRMLIMSHEDEEIKKKKI